MTERTGRRKQIEAVLVTRGPSLAIAIGRALVLAEDQRLNLRPDRKGQIHKFQNSSR